MKRAARVADVFNEQMKFDQAAIIANALWQRDPLAFRLLCLACLDRGMTLLERIVERANEIKEMQS